MRFAIVEGKKAEATPRAKGVCPNCTSELIAKCGRVKVWHWAHKGNPPCDPWFESETEWHRTWKSCFPIDWQEVSHTDSVTGEKHIADVKTPFGLVIEFQHSPITPEERDAREKFYKKMIWIVNGNRAQSDLWYFERGLKLIDKDRRTFEIKWEGPSMLLHNWSDSSARVFFDFGGPELWRLLEFDKKSKIGSVKLALKISLQNFINEKVAGQRSELDEMQLTLLALKIQNNRSKGLPGFERYSARKRRKRGLRRF